MDKSALSNRGSATRVANPPARLAVGLGLESTLVIRRVRIWQSRESTYAPSWNATLHSSRIGSPASAHVARNSAASAHYIDFCRLARPQAFLPALRPQGSLFA